MAIPTQDALRNPLLMELAKIGGTARPADLYNKIAAHFADLTPDDLKRELSCGHNVFANRVQWVRQRLVEEGLIDKSVRGIWKLTSKGCEVAAKLNGTHSPPNAERATTLVELMDEHDEQVRRELRSLLQIMPPARFEQLGGQLLRALGFRNVQVTQVSRDGGIDGFGRLKMGIVEVSAAFQCKRWQASVGRPEIDTFRGATQGKFDQAIYLCTSSFSKPALDESIRPGCIPIVMVDGTAIVDLMIEHGIGVSKRPLVVPQVDEDYFASEEEAV